MPYAPANLYFMVKVNGEWVRATKNSYPVVCTREQLQKDSPVVPADDADFYVPLDELMR